MTLENTYYKLSEVLNQLEQNNESHYNLNQTILSSPPEVDNSQESKGVASPEGMLSKVYDIIWRLEKQVNFQNQNLRRTNELINSPEIAVACNSKY